MNLLVTVTVVWVAFSRSILVSTSSSGAPNDVDFKFIHHDHPATVAVLKAVNEKCPDISRIYNLSETSVQGRELIVIELTENPGKHVSKKPEFKYVGNMHGNEVVGKEMLLRLVTYLCDRYLAADPLATFLLRHTRIHIMPTMNPDGWHKAYQQLKDTGEAAWLIGRNNANDVDLNRNFPDLDEILFESEKSAPGLNNHLMTVQKALNTFPDLQPETRAVMRWMSEIGFVLSANLHGGDLVVNYPYDTAPHSRLGSYSATPDDKTFIKLAKSYSYFHKKMSDSGHELCDPNSRFKDGVTNGDAWYPVAGGMQDYNYLQTNCFEVTVEMGCNKFPPQSSLHSYWQDNKWALLNFMLQAHMGIKGVVSSGEGRPIINAVIHVVNLTSGHDINHDILSLSDGDYYRLLDEGAYKVSASAKGYHPASKCITVNNPNYMGASKLSPATELDFVLQPESEPRERGNVEAAHCRLMGRLHDKDEVKEEKLAAALDEKENHALERHVLEEVLGYLHHQTHWRSSSLKPSLSYLARVLNSELSNLSTEERARLLNVLLHRLKG